MWLKPSRLVGSYLKFKGFVSVKPSFSSDNFGKLVDLCVAYYKENRDKMRRDLESVCRKRVELSDFVEVFHRDCGTLTPSVRERIVDLRSGECVFLMTAHQPNFFAYSGVFRKATLGFVLARKLEEILGFPVVNFFGIADQDFTDDKWVRSCQLPAVRRSDGTFTLNVKLPEKLMLNRVAKPLPEAFDDWRNEIEKWLGEATRSVKRLCKDLGFAEMCPAASISSLHENLTYFWNVVEECYERSKSYSDFNAFLMSKIVNDIWGYDTIFARFSECQQIFVEEFNFLLTHFKQYSRLVEEALQTPAGKGLAGGVSEQEPFLIPFWYHCNCGSKVKLFSNRKNRSLFGEGNCLSCGRFHELELGAEDNPDVSYFAARISARALSMPLVFFKGLMPSCYVGGVGGVKYLTEAEHVARGLGITFPPIVVWRPHDKYFGVGQVEALLELKRICRGLGVRGFSEAKSLLEHRIAEIRARLDELEASRKRILEKLKDNPDDEGLKKELIKASMVQTEFRKSSNLSVISRELKILENVSVVLGLMPSIIDYAVNIGLEKTSDQWVKHLLEDGSLALDVNLESVLDKKCTFGFGFI